METLLQELLAGKRRVVWSPTAAEFSADIDSPPAGLLCGAFNPLHDGHRELRRVAQRLLSGTVGYELSAHNAEKASLAHAELLARCRQFEDDLLAVTAAATFAEKAELLPETTFVVGIDTAVRIVDPRFYDSSNARMHDALSVIRDQGCRFLVAGRVWGDGFTTLGEIELPAGFVELFVEITEAEFREDISSTELRDD